MHYPFCVRVIKTQITGKIFTSSNGSGIALPSLLWATGSWNPVPGRGLETPSSPWLRNRGGFQPQTPHSSQTSARWSKANRHKTRAAVRSVLAVGTTESSVLHLWTCSVVTSSHVAWKDAEMVVVCMWPLISLMIFCIDNTKRKALSYWLQSSWCI